MTSSRVLPVFQQQLSEEGKAQHRRLQRFLDLWDTGPCLLVVSELSAHETIEPQYWKRLNVVASATFKLYKPGLSNCNYNSTRLYSSIYMAMDFSVCVCNAWFLLGWENEKMNSSTGLLLKWRFWCKHGALGCWIQLMAMGSIHKVVLPNNWNNSLWNNSTNSHYSFPPPSPSSSVTLYIARLFQSSYELLA